MDSDSAELSEGELLAPAGHQIGCHPEEKCYCSLGADQCPYGNKPNKSAVVKGLEKFKAQDWMLLKEESKIHTSAGGMDKILFSCCYFPNAQISEYIQLMVLVSPYLDAAKLSSGLDCFSSKNLALQAQKKLLSKMATKTMANMLIDDTSSEIFDELYKVTREHTRNKKEAHKIMKDLIKVAIKIGILYRNNQFNQEELEIVDKFRKKLNQTAMTIVSFYEVEYTFDRNVLSELLNECKDLVHELVERHLTPRSHGRINHVFNHFADVEFLTALYSLDGDCRPYLKKICDGINKLLDEKVL
ncbi:Tumor necrosis factor alpha-induced protein 8-like protein 3 [Chelonia mydas]|uniref:Tumor necrosis factor alpha-induced protein 8-like protein 3 n=2 Tax=Cheloniidae TaxID=8465 RepID=M7B124_CHEMY|nr:Tumor necrosis factor alpha-induced protein 8-like protein 3 [Chelonia mydas]